MPGKRPTHPVRVFISHSHGDRVVATDLQRVLMKFGAETFLDQDKVQVADVLPDRIRQGIEWCDMLLLIWSSSAAASDWVDKEWNTAYELRRKIVPYCLDSASLPPALENLVYPDRKDAQVAHAGLLHAVFGKDFSPPRTEIFPGRWRLTLSAFGLGTATYELELRPNGQVTGSAKMDEGGAVGEMMRSVGTSDLLNVRSNITGTWEYEEHTEILTLDFAAHGLGQEFRETVQVRMTGREVGEIQGKDFSGRAYAIRRLPGAELKERLRDLERSLGHLASVELSPATIQQEVETVLASGEALESHRNEMSELGDAELNEEFNKICGGISKFKTMLEANEKQLSFPAKKLGMKLFAEVLRTQHVQKLLNVCFAER